MRIITVKCRVHGEQEIAVEQEREQDLTCLEKINGKPCGERLERVYNAVPVHFKCGGFYGTDNGK